jgi:hypothetical protein
MTPAEQRYDDTTVELVAGILAGWRAGGRAAVTVLDALADAGLLLPPGGGE